MPSNTEKTKIAHNIVIIKQYGMAFYRHLPLDDNPPKNAN